MHSPVIETYTQINNVWLAYKISKIHATTVFAVDTGTGLRGILGFTDSLTQKLASALHAVVIITQCLSLSRKVLPPCMQKQQGP